MYRKIISSLTAMALLVTPLFAQTEKPEFKEPSGFSLGVAQESQTAFLTLHHHLKTGSATSKDFVRASMALRMTFANWDESGFTDKIQTYILDNEQRFLDGPTADEVHQGFLTLKSQLGDTTESEYSNNISQQTVEKKKEFITYIKTYGLKSFNQKVLAEMESTADRMARKQMQNPFILNVNTLTPLHRAIAVPNQPVQGGSGVSCSQATGLSSLYLGVVAMAVAGPVGVAIGVISLAIGAYSVFVC